MERHYRPAGTEVHTGLTIFENFLDIPRFLIRGREKAAIGQTS